MNAGPGVSGYLVFVDGFQLFQRTVAHRRSLQRERDVLGWLSRAFFLRKNAPHQVCALQSELRTTARMLWTFPLSSGLARFLAPSVPRSAFRAGERRRSLQLERSSGGRHWLSGGSGGVANHHRVNQCRGTPVGRSMDTGRSSSQPRQTKTKLHNTRTLQGVLNGSLQVVWGSPLDTTSRVRVEWGPSRLFEPIGH